MATFTFYKVQIAVQPGIARDAFVDALNDALADALPSAGLRNAEEPYFELRAGAVRTGIVRMGGDSWDCAAVLRAMADVSRRFEAQTFSFSCEGEEVLTLRDGHFGDSHEAVEQFLEAYAPGDDGRSEIARPATFEVTEIAFEADLEADLDVADDRAGEERTLSDLEARIREDLSPPRAPGIEALSVECTDRVLRGRVHLSRPQFAAGVLTRLQGAGVIPPAITKISLLGPQGARHYDVPSFFDWIPILQELMFMGPGEGEEGEEDEAQQASEATVEAPSLVLGTVSSHPELASMLEGASLTWGRQMLLDATGTLRVVPKRPSRRSLDGRMALDWEPNDACVLVDQTTREERRFECSIGRIAGFCERSVLLLLGSWERTALVLLGVDGVDREGPVFPRLDLGPRSSPSAFPAIATVDGERVLERVHLPELRVERLHVYADEHARHDALALSDGAVVATSDVAGELFVFPARGSKQMVRIPDAGAIHSMSVVDAEQSVLLLDQESAIQLVELAGERRILSVPRDRTSRALGRLSRNSPAIVRYDDERIVVTDHEGTWCAPAIGNASRASRIVEVALSRHGVLAALVVRDDDTGLLQLSRRNGESSCIEVAPDHLFGGLAWGRGGE